MKTRFKIDIKKIIKHWFTTYLLLKLIAFILAILLWFYIGGELRRYLL